MKHLSAELEAVIREQYEFVAQRSRDYLAERLTRVDEDGIPPKCEANELECAAWKRALNWVLDEAHRKGVSTGGS